MLDFLLYLQSVRSWADLNLILFPSDIFNYQSKRQMLIHISRSICSVPLYCKIWLSIWLHADSTPIPVISVSNFYAHLLLSSFNLECHFIKQFSIGLLQERLSLSLSLSRVAWPNITFTRLKSSHWTIVWQKPRELPLHYSKLAGLKKSPCMKSKDEYVRGAWRFSKEARHFVISSCSTVQMGYHFLHNWVQRVLSESLAKVWDQ